MVIEASQNRLSRRVTEMEESATLKMAAAARKLKDEGKQVISLSIGEPDFDTPQNIKEAAKKALDDGYTKYTPVNGLPELRKAISKKFKEENGLDYTIDQIVVSNGAKQSIANLVMALIEDGDEVILFSPYWVSYKAIVELNGGLSVELHAGIEHDFKVSAQQLEAAITDKTKMLIFSSPCNPSGSVYTYSELKALARVLANYPYVTIVSDEIYEYINFTPEHCSIGSFPEVAAQTVTVNGFSKGFSMTGWRLGYIGAPMYIASACTKIQGQFTSGASSFGQMAAVYALEHAKEDSVKMKNAFQKRRDIFVKKLDEIEGFKVNYPTGAFYVFPDVSYYFGKSFGDQKIKDADDFALFLLNEALVATVAGGAFGTPECIRLSYAASTEELLEAVERIKKGVAKLK